MAAQEDHLRETVGVFFLPGQIGGVRFLAV